MKKILLNDKRGKYFHNLKSSIFLTLKNDFVVIVAKGNEQFRIITF